MQLAVILIGAQCIYRANVLSQAPTEEFSSVEGKLKLVGLHVFSADFDPLTVNMFSYLDSIIMLSASIIHAASIY